MTTRFWRSRIRVQGADADGFSLLAAVDRPVDVLFGEQRVWSFWLRRDTEPAGLGGLKRHATWPRQLRRFLDGHSDMRLRDAATGTVLWHEPMEFGTSPDEIRVVNSHGAPLGTDKSGNLVPTFSARSQSDIDALVSATGEVLGLLEQGGIEPFLAYGTLLGAVREGRVLGHDSDADVGYVSRFADPIDVCLESFRLQRSVAERGYATERYSGAAFKILVPESDGHLRGLDVFGGFMTGGRLYLMGEVGVDFAEEWVWPLGAATLEGVDLPVPARPEKFLEAMYGPGWRVPDPAFVFTTPRRTTRALNDWFRGLRPDERVWARQYSGRRHVPLPARPSRLAKAAANRARRLDAEVLEVAAGRGGDAVWLAREGIAVTAYEYVHFALTRAEEVAHEEGLPLKVRRMSLTDLRAVLGEGARLAADPKPRVIVARHALDAMGPRGRTYFARFCSLALRAGGVAMAEVHAPDAVDAVTWGPKQVNVPHIVKQWYAAGAATVEVSEVAKQGKGQKAIQIVGEWTA